MKLDTKIIGRKIYCYKDIPSTSEEAKRLAGLGVREGTVVLSESQSQGRGKLGRSWFSPKGGIYLSIIIKPHINLVEGSLITILGSLAVARAIRGLTHLEANLKWPNDVMIHGRKVAGVLTEKGSSDSFIVGIGINVNTRKASFPDELRSESTSIRAELGSKVNLEKLIPVLLEEFEKLYLIFLSQGAEKILDEWKTLSSALKTWVKVLTANGEYEGKIMDLGKSGELILRDSDGNIQRFTTGEVVKLRST